MKKYIAAAALAFVSFNASAQIPTTDVALNGQTMANQIATMAQWAQQIAEMKAQYDQMQMDYEQMVKEYESITGSRGLGSVSYNSGISGMITEPSAMYSGSGQTPGIISAEQAKANNGTVESVEAAIREREMLTAASHKAATLKSYDGAKQRLTQIESLMAQINSTQDPKAIQELQARIGIEQAALQNEQNKLNLVAQAQDSEVALLKQQKINLNRRIMNPANTAMPGIN